MKATRRAVLFALCVIFDLAAPGSQAANTAVTVRQHLAAHCQFVGKQPWFPFDPCTGIIEGALNDAARNGTITAHCIAARPPLPSMTLSIALWLVSHHDLDNKPIAAASVMAAERLWPCSRAR